ncbi:MAG: hypothetical protein PVJ38_02500 [Candidatus Bathyarchaeota archaeon]
MKRGKAEPLVDDVALCVQMGWTHDELDVQPARFVDRLRIYLGALGDKQAREQQRLEDELDRMRRRR